jgi:hypothetical protein
MPLKIYLKVLKRLQKVREYMTRQEKKEKE